MIKLEYPSSKHSRYVLWPIPSPRGDLYKKSLRKSNVCKIRFSARLETFRSYADSQFTYGFQTTASLLLNRITLQEAGGSLTTSWKH